MSVRGVAGGSGGGGGISTITSTGGTISVNVSGSTVDLETNSTPIASLPTTYALSLLQTDVLPVESVANAQTDQLQIGQLLGMAAVKPAATMVATAAVLNNTGGTFPPSGTTISLGGTAGTTAIDGVTLAAGQVVLLTAQATGSQNGPWNINSGAWTRPTWYSSGSTSQAYAGVSEFILQGTAHAGYNYYLSTTGTITIDTTATNWNGVAGSGGGGTPAGPSTAVQYNNGGAFGGSANLEFNATTGVLSFAGTAPAITSSFNFNIQATGTAVLELSTANSGATDNGGIFVTGGSTTTAQAGSIAFTAGSATGVGGTGGGISFTGGSSPNSANAAGSINFTAAQGSTNALNGQIQFWGPLGGITIDAYGDVLLGYAEATGAQGAFADQGYDYVTSSTSPITVPQATSSLVFVPAGTVATMTIKLPPSPIDGQWFDLSVVNFAITALTLQDGSGTAANVLGAPTTAAANSGFGWKFSTTLGKWMRRY